MAAPGADPAAPPCSPAVRRRRGTGRSPAQVSQHRRQRAYPEGRILRRHRFRRWRARCRTGSARRSWPPGRRPWPARPRRDRRRWRARGAEPMPTASPATWVTRSVSGAAQRRRGSPRLLLEVEPRRSDLRRDRPDLPGRVRRGCRPRRRPARAPRWARWAGPRPCPRCRARPAGRRPARTVDDEPGELEHRVGPVGEARGAGMVSPAVELAPATARAAG